MNVVYIYIYKSKYVYTRYVFRRLDLSSGWEEWEEWEEWDRQEQCLAIGPLSFSDLTSCELRIHGGSDVHAGTASEGRVARRYKC